MAKQYYLRFGTTKASNFTGLSPTFTIFSQLGLTSVIGPTIIENPSGSGLYQFIAGTTISIIWECDGGSVLASTDRYLYGSIDPIQAVDDKVGTLQDSFGSTSADPATMLGYLKRNLEFHEGNANFDKTAAIWSIYTRGSSTQIASKTLTNTISAATKT